jgi:hypothetical protein
MDWLPKLHRELRLKGEADSISHDLVAILPAHHVAVQQFFPGVRIIGAVFRPASFTWGQEVRIDFRPVGGDQTDAVIESRFLYPAPDFTHENERNVSLLETLLLGLAEPVTAELV